MEAETAYINMLNFMLSMDGIYFSNTYDLTVSQQKIADFGPECKNMSLFERVFPYISFYHNYIYRRKRISCGIISTWRTGIKFFKKL